MTFKRLRPSDWIVFVAALALLFTTAPDWYSTTRGDAARQIQKQATGGGQADQEIQQDASALAESQERNAWQEDGFIDRLILIALLATSALGVAASFWRASGRGSDGLGPYGLAGMAACITALLVLYRIIQEPGLDELTTVKIGAPLALGVLGVMAFACATSVREPAPTEPAQGAST